MRLVEPTFEPDFDASCRVCGTTPCVVVIDHIEPETELCGPCFFGSAEMLDWENWNNQMESTE